MISAIETSCTKSAKKVRALLLKDNEFCKREGNLYKVIQSTNIPVESGLPSLPAEVITGTSMQGPNALKNKDGKTFAELYSKEKKECTTTNHKTKQCRSTICCASMMSVR